LSIIEIEIDKGRSTVHEILIEIDKLPRSDVAPRKTSHLYMNIYEPRPCAAAAIYVDFNQDFMHSRTWSIGMAVLVPCRFQSRFLASKNQSGFLATGLLVRLQDFRINLDFNQDFMHSGTGSIGIAVLVPLSISISISIRKIDIMEQCL
jgi:hypothetical protein